MVILDKGPIAAEKMATVALRDIAVKTGDRIAALTYDNTLEELGMHSDHRKTCYTCQKIVSSDHSHSF